ncbi:MAG: DUF5666 domain-containing protein [Pseudomonadota bacterium]
MSVKTTRRRLLFGLGAVPLILAGCRSETEDRPPLTTGGRADRPAEGGIGGTGIVGTLLSEGLGPNRLAINGLQVMAPDDLQVADALGVKSLAALQPGHAVTLEAETLDDGTLLARAATLVQPLSGEIEAVTPGGFQVLGNEVILDPGAILLTQDGQPLTPTIGQRVAVSGLWRDQSRVVATRVDEQPADAADVIAAVVREAESGVTLGGVPLVLPLGEQPPAAGSYATAVGRLTGGRLMTSRLGAGRFSGLAGPLTRLSVEGYLEPVAAAPGYIVADLGHSFDPKAKLAPFAKERALFTGPYTGDFAVAFALPLPEAVSARTTLLAQVQDGFAPADASSTR